MFSKRIGAQLLLLAAFASRATAEDAAATRGRVQRMAQASALDDIKSKPWHAKLALTVFDSAGKNPVEGTIEYSGSGSDWLRVITLGGNSETTLRHDGHSYSGVTGAGVPYIAEAISDEFLHAGPSESEIDASDPVLRKQDFGKISLDCIMLSRKMKGVSFLPLGLYPTYCMFPASDRLAVSYDFGSRTVTISRSGRFLEHDVPMELSIGEDSTVVARAKLTSLSTFEPAANLFSPEAQLMPAADAARVSAGAMAGQILTNGPPSYAETAMDDNISGTVVMEAMIGRDGHTHVLHLVSAPDPTIAIATLVAVRKWTYKPYLLNGQPVEVHTTVVINFSLHRY